MYFLILQYLYWPARCSCSPSPYLISLGALGRHVTIQLQTNMDPQSCEVVRKMLSQSRSRSMRHPVTLAQSYGQLTINLHLLAIGAVLYVLGWVLVGNPSVGLKPPSLAEARANSASQHQRSAFVS